MQYVCCFLAFFKNNNIKLHNNILFTIIKSDPGTVAVPITRWSYITKAYDCD